MSRVTFWAIPFVIAPSVLLLASADCKSGSSPGGGWTPAPAPASVRPCACVFVGGDARNDRLGVVPWAIRKAKEQDACAFVFLGDMELNAQWDPLFQRELTQLDAIPFYPVLGNHEVKLFGIFGFERGEQVQHFARRFLGNARTPVTSRLPDRVAYSADIDGGIHFVALDNVSDAGFGKPQLDWLRNDLAAARTKPGTRYVVVGMHKALAGNGVTTHSMDEDGEEGTRDSASALAMFRESHVDLVVASHYHAGIAYRQDGIRSYITGGLGAPIARDTPRGAERRHHVLKIDARQNSLDVTLMPFDGPTVVADTDEDEGKE